MQARFLLSRSLGRRFSHAGNERVYDSLTRAKFEILSTDELTRIHDASLDVLANAGVRVDELVTRKMLGEAGAQVDKSNGVVKIPEDLVNEALKKAPREFLLYGRDGVKPLGLGQWGTYFTTGGYATYVYDLTTGARREVTSHDLADAVRLADALPNCDLVANLPAAPRDVPQASLDRHQWAIGLTNTRKHVLSEARGYDSVKDAIAMAATIAGSTDALKKKPIITFDVTTISPLTQDRLQTQEIVGGARNGIPVSISPGPMAGASSPVTLAGTMTQANAEFLSGLVLSQVASPGAPVIYACWARHLDQKTANVAMGTPEFALLRVCQAQLGRHYGLPTRGGGLVTDSKVVDAQSGYEKMATCLIPAMGGLNIVAGMAMVDSLNTMSFEQFIMDEEIVGFARRVLEGIDVTAEKIAADVIKAIGPGGSFLGTKHSLKHFREELWMPQISDRTTWSQWHERGEKGAQVRARETAKKLLASHQRPALPGEVEKKIWSIVGEAEKRQV
jgi:trimethylamine--corrinoid protein Co-methyltransferase